MRLIIEDIKLIDNATSTGGVAFDWERLSDLLSENLENNTWSVADMNRYLFKCGIEPITLEQIRIIGKV